MQRRRNGLSGRALFEGAAGAACATPSPARAARDGGGTRSRPSPGRQGRQRYTQSAGCLEGGAASEG
ncbi:MAG TPA: hypothetical protein VH599_08970 [Ktedonobacterales bacterium]